MTWEIITDIFNYSYVECLSTGSKAYFANDGKVFYFYDLNGDKNSLLYHFFLVAYKIPLGFYEGMKVKDTLPVDVLFNKLTLIPQDFVAPFFMFLGSQYEINYEKVNDTINASEITLNSHVNKTVFRKKLNGNSYSLKLSKRGIDEFKFISKNKSFTAQCIN